MTELFVAIGLLAIIQSTEIIDWLCDKIASSFNKTDKRKDDRRVKKSKRKKTRRKSQRRK